MPFHIADGNKEQQVGDHHGGADCYAVCRRQIAARLKREDQHDGSQ